MHIEQPQVDGTTPTFSPDLNHLLHGSGRLSTGQDLLALRRIHRWSVQGSVESADGLSLQGLDGYAYNRTRAHVGIQHGSVDACEQQPIDHTPHDCLERLLLLGDLLV